MISILRGSDVLESVAAGGKAHGLMWMERAGLVTPPWFVIMAQGAWDVLTPEDRRAIETFAQELCRGGALLAVRSSAVDEDGAGRSFAGQLESYLNVDPRDVVQRVQDVWRSSIAPRVIAYRRQHGLELSTAAPGVIVQQMIAARSAGVAFSADPVSGRRGVVVVSAVRGLGDALVAGVVDGDTWHVDRAGAIIQRRTVSSAPALSDENVRAVASLARAAERAAGRPQDVEWALSDRLYLLQSRPITSIGAMPDPDAPLTLWDNSNIVESYSGSTTPLTFSFAREIYEHVYRQFCRAMAVPSRAIAESDDVFRNMLGLVRGRMYYNLLNWYRLLALLPGYRLNRGFMEQMMGVKEPLPDGIAERLARTSRARRRIVDAALLARTIAGLVFNHFTINRRVNAFSGRLRHALQPSAVPLEAMRADELVSAYCELRSRLLHKWDAPIVNDFLAMLFYGGLCKLSIRWIGLEAGAIQNDLITGEGGMISAEPALRIQRLARLAADDPALVDLLTTGTITEIQSYIAGRPEFRGEYREYLDRFGERMANELKLESATLHDDPSALLKAVGALARQLARGEQRATAETSGDRLRKIAQNRSRAAFAGRPARRILFTWILRHARRRIRDRENLRFERTRLFGRVRRIFVELGRRLHADGVLDDPRDVFYLEVEEVLAFVEGRSTCPQLSALADVRKREFDSYRQLTAPDDRFETRGVVYRGHHFRSTAPGDLPTETELRGVGCSPGIVRGRVVIVSDPATVDLSERSILVAQHTDPGWIMVFPSALGVLVERGSLLSHAAIVARELGIPAIVSVPGLTRSLQNGDVVEMDGSTGVIRRVEPAIADGVRCA